MTTRAAQLGGARTTPQLWLAGAAGALVLGGAAAWNARVAVALAAAIVIGAACLRRRSALLSVMIAAVFVEVVSLGGITVTRLVAPVALFALALAFVRGAAVVRFAPPLAWAFAYSLWAVASGLWTFSSGATAFQLSSLGIALVYMLVFAALLSTRADLERVLTALAGTSLVIGLFAIAAFAAGGARDLQQGRSSGGTGDPNFFAAYQVVALPLVLVLAGETRRRWLRLGLYTSALVLIASVLTTLSRGGLVALAAVTILTLVLPSRTIFRRPLQKFAVVLAVLVAAGGAFNAVSGSFLPRLQSMLSEGGGSGRLILWQGALTAVKERPWTGVGYGAYMPVSNDMIFKTPGVSLADYDLHPAGQPAHSAYLGTAAELGLPGLALFLGLLVSTARALRRAARRARAVEELFTMRVANALLISLAGWAVASLFLSSETSRPLWIVVGIALALPKLLAAGEEGGDAAGLRLERPAAR
jgi:putative inorganic carbon (HCO3(-)) transporter